MSFSAFGELDQVISWSGGGVSTDICKEKTHQRQSVTPKSMIQFKLRNIQHLIMLIKKTLSLLNQKNYYLQLVQ